MAFGVYPAGHTTIIRQCPRPPQFPPPFATWQVVSTGGAWVTAPAGFDGVNTLRWYALPTCRGGASHALLHALPTLPPLVTRGRYLDFPKDATRNDVTLPAGRVYFSSTCFAGEAARVSMQAPAEEVVDTGSVQLINQGGLTIKGNGPRNLWGAFGDVMLILGRFSLSSATQDEETGGGGGE